METKFAVSEKLKRYVFLHALFLLYSTCGVLGKFAAREPFLSIRFLMFYGFSLLILVVYSLFWQRALQIFPLTTAFASKGAVTLWGILWGAVLFQEGLSVAKSAAAVLIVSGIVIWGKADG
jgi:drug/metabolite transporter (DMT)-like permease